MKKIVLIAAVGLALTSTFVFAQQKQDKGARITRTEAKANAEMRAERTAERMNKELSLTPEQRKEIYSIALESYKTDKQTEATQKVFNQRIDKVLTTDQKELKVKLENDKKALRTTNKERRVTAPAGERKTLKQ